ncbi:Gfo/Idh/MocA family protein [Arthrobacter sp. 35W]|uniref:Gfo/Idh/MocA family protein n=1 Tax=Arthrobacter sp. 35W TaxID=1132441 RepID=UPI00041A8FA7|nr:dehydrogenase [Arthrobacter sp. 35W]
MTATSAPLRFGLIGVDSPHAPSFTRLLGDGVGGAVAGATVASAWAGVASADFPPSRDRMADFVAQMAGLGVPLRESLEEVAEESDALLLVASDTRTHPGLFARLAPFGKPVYVDTRFAQTAADAARMLEQAEAGGTLVLAGSPKRFTPEFLAAAGSGPVERIDLTGPLPTQPGHPGLAWYGVHQVDLAVAALGPGCKLVDATGGRVVLHWSDGRVATLGGEAEWSPLTSGRISRDGGPAEFTIEACEDMLTGLLEAIVAACRTGSPMMPASQIREIVAIVEAANLSLDAGRPVALAELRSHTR